MMDWWKQGTAAVVVERSLTQRGILGWGLPFCHVVIMDRDGKTQYKDTEENLPAQFRIYLSWDDEGRLWLRNSDDQKVYFWERIGDEWEKVYWGYSQNRQIEGSNYPPSAIYGRRMAETKSQPWN